MSSSVWPQTNYVVEADLDPLILQHASVTGMCYRSVYPTLRMELRATSPAPAFGMCCVAEAGLEFFAFLPPLPDAEMTRPWCDTPISMLMASVKLIK